MDLHTYTRELLEKHIMPELKEIAQALGIIPKGNKTRRETWVAALVGQPLPIFQQIEVQRQEPIENSPGVDRTEDIMESWTAWEKEYCAWLKDASWCVYRGENKRICSFLPTSKTLRLEGMKEGCEYCHIWEVSECACDENGNPLPVSSSLYAQGLIENCADVDRVEEPAELSDLESALAEIARLRAQNKKLLELARSQSEQIRRAKDISPVEKPSLKRVLALAQAACLDISKSLAGGWTLSMGSLKRSFKKLRDIWDLLISDDWYLMDLFSPPPPPLVAKPLFAPIHSKYSAIPFSYDNLIDTWSLGVNVESGSRSPPAGGDAM